MKNIRLNPGGVIGAVILMGAAIVTAVLTSPDNIGGRIGGFGVIALFLGAFGGNYIWDRLFPKNK